MSGVKYLIEPFACQKMPFLPPPCFVCVLCCAVCGTALVTCQCVCNTSDEEGTLSLTAVTARHHLSKGILLTH